jgi:protein-L-isoaspartate(D-aspartate) O-methyltransferase
MSDYSAIRRTMVDTQLRTYDVNSKRLLDAIETVGREHYAPAGMAELAYVDQSLTIASGEGESRSLLQPMVLARMIQSVELKLGEKALSVAGGTGYGAAVMAAMGASVTLLESDEGFASQARQALASDGVESVAVVTGDLAGGHAASAPYDVILVEGALDADPAALLAQLADGGRLVVVIGRGRSGRVMVLQRTGESIGRRTAFDAAAAPLAPFKAPAGFLF